MNNQTTLLRRSLKVNAVFSALSGTTFALASEPIARFLAIDAPIFVFITGIALFIFASTLLWLATRKKINKQLAILASLLDFSWVIGSIALVIFGVFSYAGNWATIVVADIVLVFAILQMIGLRRLHLAATQQKPA